MIHARTWHGGSAMVTDMTNAHKRGRKCRVFRFAGWLPGGNLEGTNKRVYDTTLSVLRYVEALTGAEDFDAVRAKVVELAREAASTHCAVYDEEIRGIDAPRPVLTAGIEGKWSAQVDGHGVNVCDLVDQHNLPCIITSDQTKARAYDLAKKVWPEVEKAQTFHDVWEILSKAGCRLHYFCRMD